MGSNDTTSTSTPVSAESRLSTYNAAMSALGSDNLGDSYQAPTTERLSTDYNQLRKDLTSGYTAGLDYSKGNDIKNFNSSAGSKGIWSSGLALKGENDINQGYAGQYAKAGADATNAATGYEAQDIANANANALTIAKENYDSSWRPADYKAGIWNGTGGVTSSSTSGGWSI